MFADDLDIPTEPIFDTDNDVVVEEEFVEGDIGPILLLRRTLLNPHALDDDWRRTAIF